MLSRTQSIIDDSGKQLTIKKRPRKRSKGLASHAAQWERKLRRSLDRDYSPVRTISDDELRELMCEDPLFAEVIRLGLDRNLIHVRHELMKLQKRFLKSQKISGRSRKWVAKQSAWLAALRQNPPTMTVEEEWFLRQAQALSGTERTMRKKQPSLSCTGTWKKQGWISKQSMKIVRDTYKAKMKLLSSPTFRKHDLVQVQPPQPGLEFFMGIIAGHPEFKRTNPLEVVVHYPVINLEQDGRTIWVREDRITLKQKYACVQDT